VHLTLGSLRTSQAVFYASAFFQLDGFAVPAPAQVTQTVGQPKAKNKIVFKSQSWFYVWLRNSKSIFLAVAFFKFVLSLVFSKQVFKFWFLRSTSFLFISKVSGSFYRVAKIGFKVFGLRFSQLWF